MAASIEALTNTLIEKILKGENLNFSLDQDGDFLLKFERDEDTGVELYFWFGAKGSNNEIFHSLALSDKMIPRSLWPQALMICNRWNREKLFPKVHLEYSDDNNEGRFISEYHIDCEAGIHSDFIKFSISLMIGATMQFWKWIREERFF